MVCGVGCDVGCDVGCGKGKFEDVEEVEDVEVDVAGNVADDFIVGKLDDPNSDITRSGKLCTRRPYPCLVHSMLVCTQI